MTKAKLEQYLPRIENGFPPKRAKTDYETKMFAGALMDAADRIKPGQFVANLSAGSAGKFARRVESRGLAAVSRRAQGESRGTVYVVTPEWLAKNPEG
jgi:hypothetical protein